MPRYLQLETLSIGVPFNVEILLFIREEGDNLVINMPFVFLGLSSNIFLDDVLIDC